MYNPVSHLVYAAMGSDVRTSIIDGAIVMEDGYLKTINLKSVLNNVTRIANEINLDSVSQR